jgi:hypothetical protein
LRSFVDYLRKLSADGRIDELERIRKEIESSTFIERRQRDSAGQYRAISQKRILLILL